MTEDLEKTEFARDNRSKTDGGYPIFLKNNLRFLLETNLFEMFCVSLKGILLGKKSIGCEINLSQVLIYESVRQP